MSIQKAEIERIIFDYNETKGIIRGHQGSHPSIVAAEKLVASFPEGPLTEVQILKLVTCFIDNPVEAHDLIHNLKHRIVGMFSSGPVVPKTRASYRAFTQLLQVIRTAKTGNQAAIDDKIIGAMVNSLKLLKHANQLNADHFNALIVCENLGQIFAVAPEPYRPFNLGSDVVRLLAFNDTLGLADSARLSSVCRFFNKAIQPTLHLLGAKKLLQHVVYGEEAQAKKMLEVNPGLLLIEATVIDYSGRTIENATAFEAALGAGDPDMVRMIVPFFKNLNDVDADEEQAKQYRKQFPNGLKQESDYDFGPLFAVISNSSKADLLAQLNHEHSDSPLCAAMMEFKERFKPGIVTTGYHFNFHNLIKAYQTYQKMNAPSGQWRHQKVHLFWQQVIGFIQCLLPACDAQAFAQGLETIDVEYGRKPERSLKFKDAPNGCYYPLTSETPVLSEITIDGVSLSFPCILGFSGAAVFARAHQDEASFVPMCMGVFSNDLAEYLKKKHEILQSVAIPTRVLSLDAI